MWQRLERRKIHGPDDTEQLCLGRLEVQAHDRAAPIRPVLGKHYFRYVELKAEQLDQLSFAPLISGQRIS
jgi:hypothetical protein